MGDGPECCTLAGRIGSAKEVKKVRDLRADEIKALARLAQFSVEMYRREDREVLMGGDESAVDHSI